MKTLLIEVPEELQTLVEQQAIARGYADVNAYVQDLLQADLVHTPLDEEYDEQFEQMLVEGVKGPHRPWTKETMAEIRQRGLARLEELKK